MSSASPTRSNTRGSTAAARRCRRSSAAIPKSLDEAGVARAAIESLAENFSDGVVAPVFWLAVGGLAGGVAYKAINTADSMIGHKSERHRDFGYASARLDDLVNLPASRLSALLIVGGAAMSDRQRRASRLAGGVARRAPSPLAERRLAGGGDGRRARSFARRSARLWRRRRSTTRSWATAAARPTRRTSARR